MKPLELYKMELNAIKELDPSSKVNDAQELYNRMSSTSKAIYESTTKQINKMMEKVINDLPEMDTEGGKLVSCSKGWILDKMGLRK